MLNLNLNFAACGQGLRRKSVFKYAQADSICVNKHGVEKADSRGRRKANTIFPQKIVQPVGSALSHTSTQRSKYFCLGSCPKQPSSSGSRVLCCRPAVQDTCLRVKGKSEIPSDGGILELSVSGRSGTRHLACIRFTCEVISLDFQCWLWCDGWYPS